MPIIQSLIALQRVPLIGVVARQVLGLYGVDFPATVIYGKPLNLPHRAPGLVVHSSTVLGQNVTLFQSVTIGRFDGGERSMVDSPFVRVVVEDDVVIYPGVVIAGGPGVTTIGRGAVIGANAVVVGSVPAGEVWAGVPATSKGERSARR
jgi:serine O-acetyltransferase